MVALAIAPIVAAQGDPNQFFPNEITVEDLERYGRYLNLSEEQAAAVREFHLEYRDRFDRLRAEKIDPHAWPTDLPDTQAQWLAMIERFQEETETIRDEIRRVDRSFFAEVETILDESQLPDLRRVRDHRERRTLRVNWILAITQRQFCDLSWLASEEVDLSDEDMAVVDSILVPYERQLTGLLKRLHVEALKMEFEPQREFQRRGHGDDPLGAPGDDMTEALAVHREVWETTGRKTIELTIDVDNLNRATSNRIVRSISPVGGELWTEAFLGEFYELVPKPRGERRILLNALSKADLMPLADREVFLTLLTEFETAMSELERTCLEAEGPLRDGRTMSFGASFEGEVWANYLEAHRKLFKSLDEHRESFLKRVALSLSPAGLAAWDEAYAAITERPAPKRTTHAGGASIQTMWGSNLFLTQRDLVRLSTLLALSDQQHAGLDEAFGAYGRAHAAILDDLPEIVWNKYGYDAPLTPELRGRIRQADELIFGAVERMVETDPARRWLSRFRLARERRALAYGGIGWFTDGLEVLYFILDSHLPVADLERAAESLDGYATAAHPLFEQLRVAYRTQYEWSMALEEEPSLYPHQHALQQARRAIARLNVDTILALGDQLESDEAIMMRDVFTRHCYGPVFDDPDPTLPKLNHAKRLGDLTAAQRDALLDLDVQHLESYEHLTDAMLRDARYVLMWGMESQDDSRQFPVGIDDLEAYRRHRFERDELNAATLVELRSILTEAQFKAIGGGRD